MSRRLDKGFSSGLNGEDGFSRSLIMGDVEMKRGLLVMAIFAAGGALLLFGLGSLQDLSKYESFKEPQIRK
jgi:hypothetical protein